MLRRRKWFRLAVAEPDRSYFERIAKDLRSSRSARCRRLIAFSLNTSRNTDIVERPRSASCIMLHRRSCV